MISVAEAGPWMRAHLTRSAFRLERLNAYSVPGEADDLARYLRGEPGPDMAKKAVWLETLRRERAAGIRRYRVRVLSRPLAPYVRFECEWGYTLNSGAGEEIYIADRTSRPPLDLPVDHDFWLLDDDHVLRLHYDDAGTPIGADTYSGAAAAPYRTARDLALAAADLDFATWWAAHPEEWRSHRAA